MLPAIHLFRASGAHRVAIVSVAPASAPGMWLIRLARGARTGMLSEGSVFGPFPSGVTRDRYAEVIAELLAEGFLRAGRAELIEELTSSSPTRRARAAQRLGWRRDRDAVGPLLAALPKAKRATPAFLDALGRIGDPKAIEAVRPHAERKLLSRRRSGVEALRNLGDVEGLASARQRGIERLPTDVAHVLATLDEHDVRKANLAPMLAAFKDVEVKRRGQIADVLYEAETPASVALARRLLRSVPIDQPHLWRYTKSVYKRTMLRHDARTFGWLSHQIEQRARVSKGSKATLKSGLDGKKRPTSVFSKKTQGYVRRLGWRYLTRVARWRPDLYAETAAEVLIHYGKEDLRAPKGKLGRFAECYLLGRILFGGGKRMRFDTRSMRMRFVSAKAATPSGAREESHPELWDLRPRAYLRVASGARLRELHDFASAGLTRHPEVIRDASLKKVIAMLGKEHAGLFQHASDEIERRFDPESPDLSLIRRLLRDEAARELGATLGERSAAAWAHRPDAVVALLTTTSGSAGARLALAAAKALTAMDAARRHGVAAAVLEALKSPETTEGEHAPLAELATRALLAELEAALSTPALVALIDDGSNAARTVAGALLGRRPEAFDVLGIDRLRAFAESELVGVRRGAHALLESAADRLRSAPAPLFVLAESQWSDTRELAFSILRTLDATELGLDGLIALCDSAHPDVQAFGRERVTNHFEDLDPQEILFRLVEHPARDMRRFAFTLVEQHLKPGFVPLSRIEGFCRAVLLDLSPDRAVKRRLLAFLTARGSADVHQAELVASLLGRVVRTHTISDFGRVIAALAEVQLAHPEIASEIELR